MESRTKLALSLLVLTASLAFAGGQSNRSFVEQIDPGNVALLVGVSHGLPGIDLDVDNVEKMVTDAAFQMKPTILEEEEGVQANILKELTRLSAAAGENGSLFFYYSGHGSSGSIYVQDGTLPIEKIRKAMEDGRKPGHPLARLVFMSDSCYSGSLLDPLRLTAFGQIQDDSVRSAILASSIVSALTSPDSRDGASNYWKKLFVFASSQADETSLAGANGSVFTVALAQAFEETVKEDGTMGMLVGKTQQYTEGHHPVARFVPTNLEKEALIP